MKVLSVQPIGLHRLYVSGRRSSANGVVISWEQIGLKEKKPSRGAKQAPKRESRKERAEQPKREGTSSASILEILQVIKPGSRKMHFSFHTSLRRHWFTENGELRLVLLGSRSEAHRGVGWRLCNVELSSLRIRISSHFPLFQGSLQEAHLRTNLVPSKQRDKCSGVVLPPASLMCKLIIKRRLEGRK